MGEGASRVLIIDDDEDSRIIVSVMLSRAGIEVDVAPDGVTALAIVEQRKPDLVMLDLAMPILSGHEVLDILRGRPATRDIPIIAFTASPVGSREELIARGYSDVIFKPALPGDLVKSVQRLL